MNDGQTSVGDNGNVVTTDTQLLEDELRLQREASDVEGELELPSLLSELGTPVRVGSSAFGVMVRRDLDITVICSQLRVSKVTELGAQLALHHKVRAVIFRNDTGEWNSDPTYPDGLYLGIRYRSAAGEWNVDIWFVSEPGRQPDLQHLKSLLPRFDERTRLAILRIKSAWSESPDYGKTVNGFAIYTAVLDDGVTDEKGFESWLAQRA
jgi:hypothetical protein